MIHRAWEESLDFMSLEVIKVEAPTDEVRLLIGELDAELNANYSAEQRHGFNISRLFQLAISFFVARIDESPAGCGGVAFADGLAEVKRMYVRPAARGGFTIGRRHCDAGRRAAGPEPRGGQGAGTGAAGGGTAPGQEITGPGNN